MTFPQPKKQIVNFTLGVCLWERGEDLGDGEIKGLIRKVVGVGVVVLYVTSYRGLIWEEGQGERERDSLDPENWGERVG